MKKKKLMVIILILLLFIIILFTFMYFMPKKGINELMGKVIISDEAYIIVEVNDKDYLVKNIKNTYEIGDEVLIIYNNDNLNELANPIEIFAIKEKMIKKAIKDDDNSGEIEQEIDETIKNEQIIDYNNKEDEKENVVKDEDLNYKDIINNQNEVESDEVKETVSGNADAEVLSYVKNIENDAFNNITKNLKMGFITIVDFLFYGGDIKGYTFNELTSKAKLEVLEGTLVVDKKIEELFPGYKETISNNTSKVYTNVKNLVVDAYLNITSKICSQNDELCDSAKQNFQTLKTSFGFTWDFIKELAGNGINRLKDYYEIWKEK